MADVECCKFKQENQSKASEQHQTLLKSLNGNGKRRRCAYQKHTKQQYEYYLTYSLRFYRKYSDVTPFVIIKIFISNCHLITHSN